MAFIVFPGAGRSQQPEIRGFEGVNPISTAPGRAAHEQRVVNLRSAPSPISNDPKRLDVIHFPDGCGLERRQNVVGNDEYRLHWVDARMHRQSRERGVHFGD